MKKILCSALALVTGTMMMLTGCGGNSAYNYDLSDYVTVGEYEGVTYDKPGAVKVKDSEIEDAIKEDLEAAKYLKDVTDGKVHDGDTVNIDYKGTIDGKEFDGGSAEGSSLEIGSGTFIDGFESGLIGKKIGSKVTLNLTFPDDYDKEDLAGKDVVFKVTINNSQEYVTPTVEKYVKDSDNYKTVSEYRKSVKNELKSQKKSEQESEIESTVWQKIVAASEVKKYPDKEMEEYKEQARKSVKKYAEDNSMEYADVLENYYSMTEEEFEEQISSSAETNVKEQMVCYSIAKDIGVEVTSDEYDDFIAAQLESIGYSEKEFKEYTGSTYVEYVGGESAIYYYLTYQKVIEHIMEKAVAK